MRPSQYTTIGMRRVLSLPSWSARPILLGLWVLGACQPVAHDRVPAMSDQCESCHLPEYRSAKNPVHEGALPQKCAVCHSTESWIPSEFHHPWALTGAHAKAQCTACHTGKPPKYKGTSTLCVDCHKPQYVAAKNPVHESALPTGCEVCHSTKAWTPSAFQHPWALTGAHATVACNACHTGTPPKYKGTGQQCVDCHRKNYDSSPYPGHQSFPTTCQDCHSTKAWKPASAGAHPENLFPIQTGAHKNIACATCHSLPGVTSKANTDCVQCHAQAKYAGKHQDVGGYPTGTAPANFCVSCHTDGRVHDN